MGKKQYVVESDFDDLHGNPDDTSDLDVDLTDADNPIITAALDDAEDDDNWKPPKDDDDDEGEDKDDDEDEDDDADDDTDDDSELDDLDGDEDDDDEDGDEDDDADDDDEDDEGDDDYSKRVQKRIDRERALRRQDKEDSDRRFAKMEKKLELRDAQDEFRKEKQDAASKLGKLKAKKVIALDEGTTTEVVEIDEEILDIKADMKAKELQLKQTEDSIDDDTSNDSTSSSTPAVGRKFLEKYPEFHTNAQFRNVLLLTDKSVAARGFDKNTEEYYAEIEKAMKPQFPKIIRGAKITTKRPKKKVNKKRRSAVGSTQKAGTRRSKKTLRRGRIRLTKADQQQMEVFGMDPTNPADAKAWATGKGS